MKKVLLAFMAVLGLSLGVTTVVTPETVSAATTSKVQTYMEKTKGSNETDALAAVQVIINVVLGVVGIIAVVMIIVGGIGFATSQGDAAKVKKGRDTILYGVIGLVVALLAFAIVNFVMKNVFGAGVSQTYSSESSCTEKGKYACEKKNGEWNRNGLQEYGTEALCKDGDKYTCKEKDGKWYRQ